MKDKDNAYPMDSFLTKRGVPAFTDKDETGDQNTKSSAPSLDSEFLKQQLDYHSRVRIEQGREKPIDTFFKILFYKDKTLLLEDEEVFEEKLSSPIKFYDILTNKELSDLVSEIEVR